MPVGWRNADGRSCGRRSAPKTHSCFLRGIEWRREGGGGLDFTMISALQGSQESWMLLNDFVFLVSSRASTYVNPRVNPGVFFCLCLHSTVDWLGLELTGAFR